MACYLEFLDGAYIEYQQLDETLRGVDVRRLSALFQVWEDRELNGFSIEPRATRVSVELPDGSNKDVRTVEYPFDTVAGFIAFESAAGDDENARILAVGTYRNTYELDQIYNRGLDRLQLWMKANGTLR